LSPSLYITPPSHYTLRANSLPTYLLLNYHQALLDPGPPKHPSSLTGAKTSVGQDSLVAENCILGERVQIRKSVLATGITIGSRTVIRGSVVMEGATVGENVKLEGCVICKGAKIGDKVSLTECFVGAGYVVAEGTKMSKQNLVELDELEDGSEDDEDDD
jgi:translation initiation factor eIF-2B subunit gamma